MKEPKILGVILARGGSKGIPRKNIKLLSGHPLIAYTISAALKSSLVSEIVVSTEDEEIASVTREYGAYTPFKRPLSLAGDNVWSRDALKHAVMESEKYFGKKYDYVIELPCIAPLRDSNDIDETLSKLISTGADSVISVCRMMDKHPVRMKRIAEDQLQDFCHEFPEGEGSRRQELEPCYIRNGAIYSMKRDTIVNEFTRIGKISRPFIMPEEKSVNIDSMIDFYIAESLIKKGLCNNHPVKINPQTRLEIFRSHEKPKLLFSAAYEFMPQIKDQMQRQFDVIFAYNAPLAKVLELIRDREAWITSPCPQYVINQEILDIAPDLRVIGTPSTGTNHIDLECARKKGIIVHSLKGSGVIEDIHASSEFSFALLLSLVKKLHYGFQEARSGVWREREGDFRSIELHEKTIGIVGFGRIGRKMAGFAQAFSMNVLAYDPHKKIEAPGVKQVELSELLRSSDIVSLHVHLTDETRNMADKSFFDSMKSGAYFVNTSRGEVVDEKALIDALQYRKIKAAAVDVISEEHKRPIVNFPLIRYAREHDNLIITPHVAGATIESESKAARYIIERIINDFKASAKECAVNDSR